jgi:hypothetical protein
MADPHFVSGPRYTQGPRAMRPVHARSLSEGGVQFVQTVFLAWLTVTGISKPGLSEPLRSLPPAKHSFPRPCVILALNIYLIYSMATGAT